MARSLGCIAPVRWGGCMAFGCGTAATPITRSAREIPAQEIRHRFIVFLAFATVAATVPAARGFDTHTVTTEETITPNGEDAEAPGTQVPGACASGRPRQSCL